MEKLNYLFVAGRVGEAGARGVKNRSLSRKYNHSLRSRLNMSDSRIKVP